MRQEPISHEDAIKRNLESWCFEVGSDFEKANQDAALDMVGFMQPLKLSQVIDLGCGDGAALSEFHRLGMGAKGIDINQEKLDAVMAPSPVECADMLWWVRQQPFLPSIFMHHSLEHVVEVDRLRVAIGGRLAPGCLFYCIVPADDEVHDVHVTAFDVAEELAPPRVRPIFCGRQNRFGHAEFKFVGVKE